MFNSKAPQAHAVRVSYVFTVLYNKSKGWKHKNLYENSGNRFSTGKYITTNAFLYFRSTCMFACFLHGCFADYEVESEQFNRLAYCVTVQVIKGRIP